MQLCYFTILGQENAKNMSPYCTVKSYSHGPQEDRHDFRMIRDVLNELEAEIIENGKKVK